MIVKSIIVLHRYLGVAVGLILTVWCLSGFVMMYRGYPFTTAQERSAALAPLDLSACCKDIPLAQDAASFSFRVEMLNGAPILRTFGESGPKSYDLAAGTEVGLLSETEIRAAAEAFASGLGIAGPLTDLNTLTVDQWSVQGARGWQPLWRAVFDDPADTWLYVNGATGEIVQDVNAHERFWNWLGAIPHWLYPTILRDNGALWSQVMIWASLTGCFLVVTGIVVGLSRLRGRSGKWFPYKQPLWLWHHVLGTFAGLLVLTWTFSGLMTMSPWGVLNGQGEVSRNDVAGNMSWGQVRQILDHAKANLPANAVTLRAAPLLGAPHMIAQLRDGSEVRFGLDGPKPFELGELKAALAAKGGLLAAANVEVLATEDDYYYGHKRQAKLPVYRVTLSDVDETRAYVDDETGELRQFADGTTKRYRWFLNAMHNVDLPFMRSRPLWDVIVITLLAAVTAVCGTGTWLALARVGRDAGRLRAFFRRR